MNKNKWIAAVAAIIALLGVCPAVEALSLGQGEALSTLGQPLRARVPFLELEAAQVDEVSARLLPAEAYPLINEREPPIDLALVRLHVESRDGLNWIYIDSTERITEPLITLLLDVHGPQGAHVVRPVELMIDLPSASAPPATAAAPAAAPVIPATPPVAESFWHADSATLTRSAPAGGAPVAVMATPAVQDPNAVTTAPLEPEAESVQPPADALAEPAGAAPEPPPASGSTYGPVHRNEILSKIAQRARPQADLPLWQVITALVLDNRKSFWAGDPSRVRVGSVLQVPSADRIRAIRRVDYQTLFGAHPPRTRRESQADAPPPAENPATMPASPMRWAVTLRNLPAPVPASAPSAAPGAAPLAAPVAAAPPVSNPANSASSMPPSVPTSAVAAPPATESAAPATSSAASAAAEGLAASAPTPEAAAAPVDAPAAAAAPNEAAAVRRVSHASQDPYGPVMLVGPSPGGSHLAPGLAILAGVAGLIGFSWWRYRRRTPAPTAAVPPPATQRAGFPEAPMPVPAPSAPRLDPRLRLVKADTAATAPEAGGARARLTRLYATVTDKSLQRRLALAEAYLDRSETTAAERILSEVEAASTPSAGVG